MGLYEQIRDVAKSKGYSINKLEQELELPRSSINKFNRNKPSVDKLQQIADFLDVPVDDLTNEGLVTCRECGLYYDPSYPPDIAQHKEQHKAWEKAEEKFGKIYADYIIRERIKANNRSIRDDASKPLDERIEAEIEILRCLFSRSVAGSGFNLNHVPFKQYISMMNKNPTYEIPQEIRDALIEKYGTEDGISSGTYYIPQKPIQTIAAHLDASDLTDGELADVQKYIDFIKTKRGK